MQVTRNIVTSSMYLSDLFSLALSGILSIKYVQDQLHLRLMVHLHEACYLHPQSNFLCIPLSLISQLLLTDLSHNIQTRNQLTLFPFQVHDLKSLYLQNACLEFADLSYALYVISNDDPTQSTLSIIVDFLLPVG